MKMIQIPLDVKMVDSYEYHRRYHYNRVINFDIKFDKSTHDFIKKSIEDIIKSESIKDKIVVGGYYAKKIYINNKGIDDCYINYDHYELLTDENYFSDICKEIRHNLIRRCGRKFYEISIKYTTNGFSDIANICIDNTTYIYLKKVNNVMNNKQKINGINVISETMIYTDIMEKIGFPDSEEFILNCHLYLLLKEDIKTFIDKNKNTKRDIIGILDKEIYNSVHYTKICDNVYLFNGDNIDDLNDSTIVCVSYKYNIMIYKNGDTYIILDSGTFDETSDKVIWQNDENDKNYEYDENLFRKRAVNEHNNTINQYIIYVLLILLTENTETSNIIEKLLDCEIDYHIYLPSNSTYEINNKKICYIKGKPHTFELDKKNKHNYLSDDKNMTNIVSEICKSLYYIDFSYVVENIEKNIKTMVDLCDYTLTMLTLIFKVSYMLKKINDNIEYYLENIKNGENINNPFKKTIIECASYICERWYKENEFFKNEHKYKLENLYASSGLRKPVFLKKNTRNELVVESDNNTTETIVNANTAESENLIDYGLAYELEFSIIAKNKHNDKHITVDPKKLYWYDEKETIIETLGQFDNPTTIFNFKYDKEKREHGIKFNCENIKKETLINLQLKYEEYKKSNRKSLSNFFMIIGDVDIIAEPLKDLLAIYIYEEHIETTEINMEEFNHFCNVLLLNKTNQIIDKIFEYCEKCCINNAKDIKDLEYVKEKIYDSVKNYFIKNNIESLLNYVADKILIENILSFMVLEGILLKKYKKCFYLDLGGPEIKSSTKYNEADNLLQRKNITMNNIMNDFKNIYLKNFEVYNDEDDMGYHLNITFPHNYLHLLIDSFYNHLRNDTNCFLAAYTLIYPLILCVFNEPLSKNLFNNQKYNRVPKSLPPLGNLVSVFGIDDPKKLLEIGRECKSNDVRTKYINFLSARMNNSMYDEYIEKSGCDYRVNKEFNMRMIMEFFGIEIRIMGFAQDEYMIQIIKFIIYLAEYIKYNKISIEYPINGIFSNTSNGRNYPEQFGLLNIDGWKATISEYYIKDINELLNINIVYEKNDNAYTTLNKIWSIIRNFAIDVYDDSHYLRYIGGDPKNSAQYLSNRNRIYITKYIDDYINNHHLTTKFTSIAKQMMLISKNNNTFVINKHCKIFWETWCKELKKISYINREKKITPFNNIYDMYDLYCYALDKKYLTESSLTTKQHIAIGGYYDKYVKYKNKYYKLKKLL